MANPGRTVDVSDEDEGPTDTSHEPPWWVRDGVLALVIGLILLIGQWVIDDRRSDREIQMSARQSDEAERRDNLRFIRDQSKNEKAVRPFAAMDLRNQTFIGLPMSGADLRSADLTDARLEGADLSDARMTGAKLYDTDLTGAVLSSADLSCSKLDMTICADFIVRVRFGKANMSAAKLVHSFVVASDFGGAKLSQADLTGIDMHQTLLNGADLSTANLTDVKFVDVCYDDETLWPANFKPPKSVDINVCLDALNPIK
jgi:hypothetical protein